MASRKKTTVVEETIIEQQTTISEDSPSPADEESRVSRQPKTGHAVNAKYVHVLERPTAGAKVIGVMELGDVGDIIDRVPGFYKIRIQKVDRTGFIPSNYFEED